MTTITSIRLEDWLNQATRHLSRDSAAQVRAEIQEHYGSAREAAAHGIKQEARNIDIDEDEADRLAVATLGDAKAANCQYRKVLLTYAEARLLRLGNWEARAVCSTLWLKWLLRAITAAVLFVSGVLFYTNKIDAARALLAGGIATSFIFTVPFLPIYTPARARFFRGMKWIALLATLILVFGPDTLKWSWLLFSCLWPMYYIERTRISLRRKLPVAQWPKQLYL